MQSDTKSGKISDGYRVRDTKQTEIISACTYEPLFHNLCPVQQSLNLCQTCLLCQEELLLLVLFF